MLENKSMIGSGAPSTTTSVPRAAYDHTQRGHVFWFILIPALILSAVVSFQTNDESGKLGALLIVVLLVGLAFSFQSLRVVDEGAAIALRYGPIPLVRKRFAYSDIIVVERDRSSVIDGWGIHWVPGRGWTYNIWGLDCVRLTLTCGRTVRIGTDDPDGLERFLRERIDRS
jgi:hypothetical protein